MATEPLDLDALAPWYTPCPRHDFGESTEACICPPENGDFRPVMSRMVAEIERLRRWEIAYHRLRDAVLVDAASPSYWQRRIGEIEDGAEVPSA